MKPNVTVSNELIRAVQGLSLPEKRLLMLAVTKLDEGLGIEQMLVIPCADYATLYTMEKSTAYKALRAGSDKLWERTLRLTDVANGARLRWVITSDYGDGSVSLRFHPDLDGHVLNLKTHFTRYLLSRAGDFKSLHTWRLFELIMQFRNTGKLVISVANFKETMETTDYHAEDFGRIRNKIINPALKEIKEKTGLKVKFTTSKTGRKITGLTFTFPTEQQTALPLEPNATKPKTESDELSAQQKRAEQAGLDQLEKLAALADAK